MAQYADSSDIFMRTEQVRTGDSLEDAVEKQCISSEISRRGATIETPCSEGDEMKAERDVVVVVAAVAAATVLLRQPSGPAPSPTKSSQRLNRSGSERPAAAQPDRQAFSSIYSSLQSV